MTGEFAGYIYGIVKPVRIGIFIHADSFTGIRLGFGKHIEYLDEDSITIIYKVFYILEIIYIFTVVAIKISLSMLIYRLFRVHLSARIISISLIALTACYLVAAVSITCSLCGIRVYRKTNPMAVAHNHHPSMQSY